jgi:Na+-driven multidrug efflux pump
MGGAIGTNIGRGVGVAYQLWGFHKGTRLRIERSDLSIDLPVVRSLLRLSAGGIAQLLVATGSYVVLIRVLAGFGSAVLAGYVVAIRVVIFILLPAWGLSNAAATLVGQNLGAGKPERAERSVWITGLWNMAFMALVTLLFVAFARPIVELFTTDAAASPVGVEALTIISYGYVFYAWGMVMMQAFNGAGDTATPTKVNVLCFWLFEIPLAYALAGPVGLGATGVFVAMALAYTLSAVIGILLFRQGKWKLKKV